MLAAHTRNLQKQSLRTLSCLLNQRNALLVRSNDPVKLPSFELASVKSWNLFDGARDFSAKSMRSKVELRMQRESGKTLREIRRAKKLRKKLMTDEERLIYNLRRAKKKVALLLQKLKKYELPELPSPRHDPELLTPEQLQAYKKIGFRNKNYVPVGVRGVFGGVVQNMHLHWKFHETVQVCCDNFPKEKIKEMATMIARLSGGVVVNIHNIKTIIMFRGRNYRQPKNLIPINTLTKRKALFKARFEQALESQKLNIKKIEQDLRRKGVNPDDPVAMASIQRVASTFFNAIDKKEGSPYVFRDDKTTQLESEGFQQPEDAGDDSDQEELDRFIAEIEDAADKEWAEEEAAEKEELTQIRYWNRDDIGGRYRRSEGIRNEDSEYENRGSNRNWNNQTHGRAMDDSDDEDEDEEWESNVIGKMNEASDDDYSEEDFDKSAATIKSEKWQHNKNSRASSNGGLKRNEIEPRRRIRENPKWDSDEGEEQKPRDSRRGLKSGTSAMAKDNSTVDNISELDEISQWESDSTSGDESNHR